MYRLSRLRLRLGIENKRLLFTVLGKVIHDSSGLLLSMLIGTNLAHYLATSIVTYMFLGEVASEHAAELFATLLTTPILFVFSELIPKNIFFYRADFIMPYVAPVVFLSHKLFTWCGAVPLLKCVSGVFARLTGSHVPSRTIITTVQRHHVRGIFADTQEEGILSTLQVNMINRLVNISNIRVRSVMTPINRVHMVDVSADRPALLAKLKEREFSRLLVYQNHTGDIIGFVDVYEALSSPEQFTNLRDFLKPIRALRANTTVIDAMETMKSENQKIILVMRISHSGRERPIGVLTMKDLVEELLGEFAAW
jgi:putative hemolysin